MSTYQVTTPSGTSFSVTAGDSDMAVMAASQEAKQRGLASCRATLSLGDMKLGEFSLEGCESRKPESRTKVNKPVLDTMNFDTVGWHSYNDAGVPSGYSKRHLIDGEGDKTLCGLTIPSRKEREVFDGEGHCDDCKACARASAKSR